MGWVLESIHPGQTTQEEDGEKGLPMTKKPSNLLRAGKMVERNARRWGNTKKEKGKREGEGPEESKRSKKNDV